MKPRHMQALVLATGLAVGVIACDKKPLPPGASSNPMAWNPECPGGDTLAIIVLDSVGEVRGRTEYFTHTVNQIPLAGVNSNVPEFHDCQRFINAVRADSLSYDSLYAIFGSAQLRTLADSADTLPYTATKRGWPAAEILSYGGTYGSLGIKPYFNCLYLYREAQSWKAKLVPNGSNENDCRDPVVDPKAAPGKELEVRPLLVDPIFGNTDYPDVARWDWDSVHLKQYIGIKCGNAWCEVGDWDFVSSLPHSESPPVEPVRGPPPTFTQRGRAFRIKGWYDRQQLAEYDAGGKLVPGPVWGTIIPHPVLGRSDHDVASYFDRWVHVATAVVSADYKTKHVTFAKGMNKIWLCSGSAKDCGVSAPVTCSSSSTGLQWWVKMEPAAGGETTFRCAIMRPHANLIIPGTSRWRWSETDETSWMRCTQGCCTIQ